MLIQFYEKIKRGKMNRDKLKYELERRRELYLRINPKVLFSLSMLPVSGKKDSHALTRLKDFFYGNF
jgi:hypothetical protein